MQKRPITLTLDQFRERHAADLAAFRSAGKPTQEIEEAAALVENVYACERAVRSASLKPVQLRLIHDVLVEYDKIVKRGE